MKKIALALVAASALGLAACGGNDTANTNAADNTEATANEAVSDVGNAETAAENALDTAANAIDTAGEAVENATDAATEAVENAAH